MHLFKRVREDGISLRLTHIIMLILALSVTGFLLYETYETSSAYKELTLATEEYIGLRYSVNELMEASDYLTDKVQCFTVTCDSRFMNEYFEEAKHNRRRDKALEKLSTVEEEPEAYDKLEMAMSESVALMETEYYAMRLISEANGITGLPDEIEDVSLSAEDGTLTSEEKIKLAQTIVHDEEYYARKERIRSNMNSCFGYLESSVRSRQLGSSEEMEYRLKMSRVLIVIESALVVFLLWITSYLGINPILKGVQKIREDSKIPIIGSYEFRYLARTYNKMYEAYKKSISNLNYDASHDKLTGLYNRAGYDVLSSSVDLKTTAALLIDADKFKEVNDTYGHLVGDKVLKKIAAALKHTFRSEDYICRLGGDEFVVFMLHMDEEHRELVRLKAALINSALSRQEDGLPPVSVSVGAAFGKDAANIKELMDHADKALYMVKEAGRNGCCFYDEGHTPGA